MYATEMSNITDVWLSGPGVFFQALNNPKLVFGRGGSAPDTAGELMTIPWTP